MTKRTVLVFVMIAFVLSLGIAFAAPMPKETQNQPKAILDSERIQKMVDDLTTRLKLTVSQQSKVKGVLTQTEG